MTMRDFEDSTLWRISEFERVRVQTGTSGYAGLARDTVLSPTLVAELNSLSPLGEFPDVIELMAACLRHREPLLIYFRCEGLIWPVTVFPAENLYHSPRNFLQAGDRALAALQTGIVEPPGVRPPGHWMFERVATKECYHPLAPALWALALRGPSRELISEVGGFAAYRALRAPASEGLPTPGALGAASAQLHRESAPLRQIARWPGMSLERAARLLNGLYLTSNLMISRTHPNARRQPDARELDKGHP
jgi:hypothetical protein